MDNIISLKEVVGVGYGEFWHFKGDYRAVKGARGSKKSKTAALWYIVNLMKYPDANLLVLRKVKNTLRLSCFTDLKWAINRLGVEKYWACTISPLEMTYKPTGQKIYFKGLDNPLKVTSTSVEHGALCWLWVEEAYEIESEAFFNIVDLSMRGQEGLDVFYQTTLTFNPWSERHWLKRRFFDKYNDNVLAITTDYRCNEFVDSNFIEKLEHMKTDNPKRYKVEGLGEWGVADGTVYENYTPEKFDIERIRKIPGIKSAFGLDFGYVTDPTAFIFLLVDEENKIIYVCDELYGYAWTNVDISREIADAGYAKETIFADAAEPKSIDHLRSLGLKRIIKSDKGADSVRAGIKFVKQFKLVINEKCENFRNEIDNYVWQKDRAGNTLNKPEDRNNHLMDAMRYALSAIRRGDAIFFLH